MLNFLQTIRSYNDVMSILFFKWNEGCATAITFFTQLYDNAIVLFNQSIIFSVDCFTTNDQDYR